MAHQIETNGSEAAAVFARTDAWHRLGTTSETRYLEIQAGRHRGLHCAWADGLLQRLGVHVEVQERLTTLLRTHGDGGGLPNTPSGACSAPPGNLHTAHAAHLAVAEPPPHQGTPGPGPAT